MWEVKSDDGSEYEIAANCDTDSLAGICQVSKLPGTYIAGSGVVAAGTVQERSFGSRRRGSLGEGVDGGQCEALALPRCKNDSRCAAAMRLL